jgi:hypothetical protein
MTSRSECFGMTGVLSLKCAQQVQGEEKKSTEYTESRTERYGKRGNSNQTLDLVLFPYLSVLLSVYSVVFFSFLLFSSPCDVTCPKGFQEWKVMQLRAPVPVRWSEHLS